MKARITFFIAVLIAIFMMIVSQPPTLAKIYRRPPIIKKYSPKTVHVQSHRTKKGKTVKMYYRSRKHK